jgi:hypothetical protein
MIDWDKILAEQAAHSPHYFHYHQFAYGGYSNQQAVTCQVCNSEVRLVWHHDHFGDRCVDLLYKHHPYRTYSMGASDWRTVSEDYYREAVFFYTFPATEVCHPCNMICPEVKKVRREIPRWVSFSPDEMVKIRADRALASFADLWAAKKEVYRPRLRKLQELGVTREEILKMWNDRSPQSHSSTEENRNRMLTLLKKAPILIQELCEAPGNERELAAYMHRADWDRGHANSFIYWYHKKHGDPSCRNNQFGIGPLGFVGWFVMLVEGRGEEAERELQRRLRNKQLYG